MCVVGSGGGERGEEGGERVWGERGGRGERGISQFADYSN